MANDYVWKHNGPLSTNGDTGLHFTKPLKEGTVFADLRNGQTYRVSSISQVKEPGYFNHVPKELMQTWDAKPIAEEQLTALRDAHKLDEDPDWPYLILPASFAE